MSGSETISSSGVPARLRSMPVMPWKSSCSDLAGVLLEVRARQPHAHLAARRRHDRRRRRPARRESRTARSGSPSAGRDRSSSCARTRCARLIVPPTARPKRIARSTAPRFSTGSTPGSAMSTAEACVFGAAPNAVDAPEKIFDAVDSCACVSSPMTTSQLMRAPSRARAPARGAMPVGRLLEPVRDVEELRFGEVVALDLQADRQAVARRSRRESTSPARRSGSPAIVKMSFRYICTGSSVFAPILNAADGAVGPMITSHCAYARAKVVGDQPPHLLRLQVVRVVVAVRQHVGADEDAALDLGAEALGARLPVHVGEVGVLARRDGRSARRRSATGSTTPRPARSRSTPGTDSLTLGSAMSTVVGAELAELARARRRSPPRRRGRCRRRSTRCGRPMRRPASGFAPRCARSQRA